MQQLIDGQKSYGEIPTPSQNKEEHNVGTKHQHKRAKEDSTPGPNKKEHYESTRPQQTDTGKYIHPPDLNPSNVCVPKQTEGMLCMLCKGVHNRRSCPSAGKVTSAGVNCHVCKAFSRRRKNIRPTGSLHLFTNAGNIKRESCPHITRLRQSERAAFLKEIGCCTVCLMNKSHAPQNCPDIYRFKDFLCTTDMCNYRKTVCPSHKIHMSLSSSQEDQRLQEAMSAVTHVDMTAKEREPVKEIQSEPQENISVNVPGSSENNPTSSSSGKHDPGNDLEILSTTVDGLKLTEGEPNHGIQPLEDQMPTTIVASYL